MKITANLAHPSSARERYGLTWAIPAAAVAFVVLILLSAVAISNFRVYRRVRRTTLEIQQEEARLRDQDAALRRELDRPQLRETYRKSGFINHAIDRRAFSVTELMEKVTKLLPDDVRLEGFALTHHGPDRLVRLAVSGTSEQQIEKFVINLEDSPDFTDVTIVSQGLPKEGPGGEPPSVACSARYVGGPPE